MNTCLRIYAYIHKYSVLLSPGGRQGQGQGGIIIITTNTTTTIIVSSSSSSSSMINRIIIITSTNTISITTIIDAIIDCRQADGKGKGKGDQVVETQAQPEYTCTLYVI